MLGNPVHILQKVEFRGLTPALCKRQSGLGVGTGGYRVFLFPGESQVCEALVGAPKAAVKVNRCESPDEVERGEARGEALFWCLADRLAGQMEIPPSPLSRVALYPFPGLPDLPSVLSGTYMYCVLAL